MLSLFWGDAIDKAQAMAGHWVGVLGRGGHKAEAIGSK